MNTSDGRRHERLARNEAHFRTINERLEARLSDLGVESEVQPFVCECGMPDCQAPVELTLAEYESIRSDSTQFAVRPGHELPEVESVVLERERYTVVRKIGLGAGIAESTDPRT